MMKNLDRILLLSLLVILILIKLDNSEKSHINITKLNDKIKVLESSNINLIKNLKTKDSLISTLKIKVLKYKNKIKNQGSVTVIKTETRVDTVFKTQNKPCNLQLYNKWYNMSILSKKDSTRLKIGFKHNLTAVVGESRKGFKRIPYVEVTDENPYTDIKSVRTYKIKYKIPKMSFGIQAGYGITKKGLSPYIGIGINYKF